MIVLLVLALAHVLAIAGIARTVRANRAAADASDELLAVVLDAPPAPRITWLR